MARGTRIFSAKSPQGIHSAAFVLKKGGVVAFPTETVYGLGASIYQSKALCRVFEVKKRPSFDPLIVHVASIEQAMSLWKEVPIDAKRLMESFWPGPLSIVLPKKKNVSDIVTSGLSTVAVRMPAHPVALALILEAGAPIAAPSANLFGRTSPTCAADVIEELGKSIDGVLDGGVCQVGLESTVVKLERGHCVLLRPGGSPVEAIEKVLRKKVIRDAFSGRIAKESPGLLESHYAPMAPMVLLSAAQGKRLAQCLPRRIRVATLIFRKKSTLSSWAQGSVVLSPSGDLYRAAANLFQAIRKLDKMKPDLIVAESVPTRGIGLAIMDRLKKASSSRVGLRAAKQLIDQITLKRKL